MTGIGRHLVRKKRDNVRTRRSIVHLANVKVLSIRQRVFDSEYEVSCSRSHKASYIRKNGEIR